MRDLQAENKLCKDYKKLHVELRWEWVRWYSGLESDPVPGKTEWLHFVKWVSRQKTLALKEHGNDDGEYSKRIDYLD